MNTKNNNTANGKTDDQLDYPYPNMQAEDFVQNTAHLWQGRVDAREGELGKRWHQQVRCIELAQLESLDNTHDGDKNNNADNNADNGANHAGVVFLGFCCDRGVARNQGRTGAAAGPDAIRKMLANLPLSSNCSLFDLGNISVNSSTGEDPLDLERAQQGFAQGVQQALAAGYLPIGLGGGHEIAYASFSGLTNYLLDKKQIHATDKPAPRIGIINFDAHFDLRLADSPNSGTPFWQIAELCQREQWDFQYACLGVSRYANSAALFARADSLGVTYVLDSDMQTESQQQQTQQTVQDFLAQVDEVYLTVCLDVLPAGCAPGVSAPAALGVPLAIIENILMLILQSGKVKLADIAEMNPHYDIDQHTARVAARLIAQMVASQTKD